MTAYTKTIYRMLSANKGRFALIVCIILVSLLLCAGLGVTPSTIEKSYNAELQGYSISDILLKSSSEEGFSDEDILTYTSIENPLATDSYFTGDISVGETNYRLYARDLSNRDVNAIDVVSGRLPEDSSECVLEELNGYLDDHEIGDIVTISLSDSVSMDLEVVGFVYNPLYSSKADEPMLVEGMDESGEYDESINAIVYIDSATSIYASFLPTNEIALRYNDTYSIFSNKYTRYIDEKVEAINASIGSRTDVNVLTIEDNVSFAFVDGVNNKILIIAIILPIFFLLVCSLVISVTTSRMVNDERQIIGCYNSLGFTRGQILRKYFLFNLFTILIGAIAGIVLGLLIVPYILYPAFKSVIILGPIALSGNIWIGLASSVVLLIVVLAICYGVLSSNLKESPAALLQQKAPKAGKKIFLEKMTRIWNKFSFSIKSCFRNIFRYKKNMILTIVSTMGCGALVFVGFGLLDNSLALRDDPFFGLTAEPMRLVSIFVIIIAAALCILVLFNLVSQNIKERTRELSTLKVLGYHDTECLLYTSRETLILSAVGSALSLPLGVFFMWIVSALLNFGEVGFVTWESYIYTFLFMIVLTIIVCAILYPQIKKLDMNESLKVLD